MTIDKEIRAVALWLLHPDCDELEHILTDLERLQPKVNVMYAKDNPNDPTCMVIMFGMQTLGYVNVDDKKYVEPLLRDMDFCEAEFLEVYREENHVPIVRFLVTVDLDEVKPIVADADWNDWNYTYPRLKVLKELSTVDYTGHLLKNWLVQKKECVLTTLNDLVEAFVDASLFDMSVETSNTYDDILFYLESSRKRNRQLINTLQHGSTVRRTDKSRDKFLKEWWPKFLNSELAKRLCEDFVLRIKKEHPVYASSETSAMKQSVIVDEFNRLDTELCSLPAHIYNKIGDMGAFWACLYYTKVPREKFIDVLSALVLYTKLKGFLEGNQPFIVKEQKMIIEHTDTLNLHGNLIEKQIKIIGQ